MYYKIYVYDNPFDENEIVSKGTESVLEAEALVRTLSEKAQAIINANSDPRDDHPSPLDVYGASELGMK